MKCRNPECVNGRTPGVVAVGKGQKGMPLYGSDGATKNIGMRWAWVNCLACSITDDQRRHGASYKHQNRSPAEIAQRAQMATDRSIYVKEPKIVRTFEAIKAAAGNGPFTLCGGYAGTSQDLQQQPIREVELQTPASSEQLRELSKKIDKLLEQNSKLAEQNGKLVDQLGEIMIENRALRMQIDAQQKARAADSQTASP